MLVMTNTLAHTPVMTKVRMSFRFEVSDVMTWRESAENTGISLSEWIRRRCNVSKIDCQPVTAPDVASKEIAVTQETASARTSGQKSCKHGVAKGWRCWQCKGIAIIE